MSLLIMRGAILAQGGAAAPPVDIGTAWQLDTTRRPTGYTLSDGNQTVINTSGGSNYQRWVPTAKAILPTGGRRYWEVLCAPGGAATFDGYLGVVSAAQREEFNTGLNPITLGSIGWRGTGALWSSNTASFAQQLTGLPTFGAGDVLMFVIDPTNGRLWIGKNGIWRDDPVSGAATWMAAASAAFHPQLQGRNPGDGGTLRSLPSQFSYPVPSGITALGYLDPDLRFFEAAAFLEIGWDRGLSVAGASFWISRGGGQHLTGADAALFLEQGGGRGGTWTQANLYIEVELP
ncbi:hypothetical protein SAMN04488003_13323 [Loktanella fryxellensis]|uniref:B30.2/SPRY domain-containing protein n=1 Tax=Loktanella fryxellensis TaxID=245187 RepID=A0A1H8J6W3_9RHOB|nr:hypothetical protein [Loktanella fryxellensis]SEN76215.1 hypothetical protein SAMN04488003_13323 [Loktanella fryxellensis]